MREIKFRAWQANYKLMYEHPFGYMEFYKDNNVIGFDDGDLRLEGDDVVLMQYTGLKDKNGKEVYEGDILQNKNGVISEVKWDSEQSRWVSLSFGMTQKAIQRDKLFIIGNVYENPELLSN